MKFTPALRCLAALSASFLLAATARSAPDAELMIDGEVLLPSTTLEVRFAREMVSREQLGIDTAPSPLAIQPALPGKFTWLSQRSGVFVPSEAPKMGTTFVIALRAKLLDAAKKPVASGVRATLKTPPFQIAIVENGVAEGYPPPPSPKVRLAFNRDVKIEGAENLFHFADDAGKTIAASVRYAIPGDYFRVPAEDDDWDRRWELARNPAQANADSEEEESGEKGGEPQRNRFIVTPVSPLVPGSVWRLEMEAGLAALAGDYRLAAGRVVPLGRVAPFTLKSLVTSSYLNSGRSVLLTFSRRA